MGAHTVASTTSESKRRDAKDLGADEVVLSRNASEMDAHVNSFDMILDTVAASHDLDAYTRLLERGARARADDLRRAQLGRVIAGAPGIA